jgi:hypothetical protein
MQIDQKMQKMPSDYTCSHLFFCTSVRSNKITASRINIQTMTGAAGVLLLKMVIAAFSGLGAATVCHPLDVIKTQMQTEGSTYSGFADAAVGIYQKNGLKEGLYAGVLAAYL